MEDLSKFLTKKEALKDLYIQSKDFQVLNKLIREYSYSILLELGDEELAHFCKGMVTDNVQGLALYNLINSVGDARRVYNWIENYYKEAKDTQFNGNLPLFIRRIDINLGTKVRRSETLSFLAKLIVPYNDPEEEDDIDYSNDIKMAIVENESVGINSLFALAKINPDYYSHIIGNIYQLVDLHGLESLIYHIDMVYNHMVESINSGEVSKFNPEDKLHEGLNILMSSDWFYNTIFFLLERIPKEARYGIQRIRDTYIKFFEQLFITNKSRIDDVRLAMEEYFFDYGFIGIDVVVDYYNNSNIEGFFATLLYGEDIYSNFGFQLSDSTFVKRMTNMMNAIDILINEKILPETIKSDPEGYTKDIEMIQEKIDNRITEFNLDDFLNDDEEEED